MEKAINDAMSWLTDVNSIKSKTEFNNASEIRDYILEQLGEVNRDIRDHFSILSEIKLNEFKVILGI